MSFGKRWREFKQMTIHIIGDSHIRAFCQLPNRKDLPESVFHNIGAHTAYKLVSYDRTSKSYPKLRAVMKLVDKEKDVVMLCLGEIDCRIHIYHQSKIRKVHAWDVLKATVFRYLSTVIELRMEGFKVGLIGIIPASRQGNIYRYKHYGDGKTRLKISQAFNTFIEACCHVIAVPYFNLFDPDLMDQSGMLRPELTLKGDLTHIDASKYPITEKFAKWMYEQFPLDGRKNEAR